MPEDALESKIKVMLVYEDNTELELELVISSVGIIHSSYIKNIKNVKSIACPICKEDLDLIIECNCKEGAKLHTIYLNKKRTYGSSLGICTNPECTKSMKFSAYKILASHIDNA